MAVISEALAYALLPVITIIAGGAIAVFRDPGGIFRSSVLHFAAGVVFSVVAVELLPDIIKNHQPIEVGIGFSMGIIVMLFVKYFTEGRKTEYTDPDVDRPLPYGLLSALVIDLAIDGLLLGVGFAAGKKEGILLAVALGLETFSLGLAVIIAFRSSTISKSKSFLILLALGITFFVGALLGISLLSNLSQEFLELVLSFGLAALLFLVTEELLTEAHEEQESPIQTACFFLGFLLFLILGMIA
ncbi:membrane protein [Flavobacterium noncentrifugens]|uniref:Zinc transporter, ZIP family n=1 Tax=Flavobacterium noncentrifugens TaxID=1128970 RepID=A0A1G8ZL16_9FLAO|nr:transporter [Flavobacterium noncentrifugens]GEP52650.1 membrane protein [Flavobacterium noncentrifugens]SDK15723.1 zinc transporter, ZIP family [Flavobacterium noncentrifugens]